MTQQDTPIRVATLADAPAISALVLSLSHHFLLDPEGRGAEDFLRTLQPEAVAARLSAAAYRTWVIDTDPSTSTSTDTDTEAREMTDKPEPVCKVGGVVVVRGDSHLFHLFVAEPFQRRALARRLWLHALSHLERGTHVTVNATPSAKGFYERMGFAGTGPAVETAGIAFVPMVRDCAKLAAHDPATAARRDGGHWGVPGP